MENLPQVANLIPIEGDNVLVKAKSFADQIVAELKDFKPLKVTSPTEREAALERTVKIKESFKSLQSKTAPVREAIVEIEGWFSAAKKAIEAAEKSSKAAIIAYDEAEAAKIEAARIAQQQIEEAEAKKRQQELEDAAIAASFAGKKEEAIILEQQAAAVKPMIIASAYVKPSGSRITYDYEVVNEDLLPPEYKTKPAPNHVMLAAIVKSDGAKVVIPGIRVFPKTGLAVRSSK